MIRNFFSVLAGVAFLSAAVISGGAVSAPGTPGAPAPTMSNVAYGPHPRQVLDLYQARSDHPTPVVLVIHGGGWLKGDKSGFNNAAPFLAVAISVVSINYRFIPQAEKDGLVPPVKGPLHDAARALQFVRAKSAAWNLDKQRIGATGSSAGPLQLALARLPF